MAPRSHPAAGAAHRAGVAPRPHPGDDWFDEPAQRAERDRRRRLAMARRRRAQRRRFMLRRAVALVVVASAATWIASAVRGSSGGTAGGDTNTPTGGGAPLLITPPLPAGTPIKLTRSLSLAAVGDTVMGSRPYGLPPDGGASLFTAVKPLLVGDVVLANLEGTIASGGTSKCGANPSQYCYAFRMPPSYAKWLPQGGINVVNLANNHFSDFGAVGRQETIANVTRVGLKYTGPPGTVAYMRAAGGTVAVIGFGFNSAMNSIGNITRAQAMVREAAKHAGVVIVTMHSGAEGKTAQHLTFTRETFLGESRGNPVRFARAVVDAGADVVVGHGPHVMRAMEIYRGRLIAYSMGNFMGYSVFALSGPSGRSAVLQAKIAPDGRFAGGRIRPLVLLGKGVPYPGGDTIARVRTLTAQDLGARGARIAANGVIAPVVVAP